MKTIVPNRVSYHNSFERYSQNFLLLFSINHVEKFNFYPNKNSKYLFYKSNDQIDALGGERQIIWHTAKVKDEVGMKKIEERDR